MIAACKGDQGNDDPRAVLKAYLSQSFSVRSVSDRSKLEEYLTGEAKVRLASWNDSDFEKVFVQSKRKFVRLAFSDFKEINPNSSELVYELVFEEIRDGKKTINTSKKRCFFSKEDDRWFIADVKNEKLLIEYQNDMSLP